MMRRLLVLVTAAFVLTAVLHPTASEARPRGASARPLKKPVKKKPRPKKLEVRDVFQRALRP